MIRNFFLITISIGIAIASFDEFSINLYKTMAKSNADENFVISPASIVLATGIALQGASRETRSQIEAALGDGEFSELVRQIANDSSIESANKIYVADRFSLKEDFQLIVEAIFDSKAQSVDFGDSKTKKIINDWVEEKTHGLIKDFIKDLGANLVSIIVNAIYFKSTWETPFGFYAEYKRSFYYSKSKKSKLSFMSIEDYFNYAESNDGKVQVLELPYKNTDIKMVILLPREIDGLKSLEDGLTAESLNSMLNKMENKSGEVELPRFKIEFESELNGVFNELGMTRMFSPSDAEFEEFVHDLNPYVSDVIHKAVISVNENGTVAAAATRIEYLEKMMRKVEYSFTADRPFLFLLKNADHIFFMGRVVDPKYE